MKKFFFVLLGLAVVGVAGLIAMCQFTGNKLKPLVDELMVDCDAGRYAEAYERGAAALKSQTTFESFRDYMTLRKKAFGAYKGLGSVKGFQTKRGTENGDIDGVTVELNFENATVDGKFTFVKEDGAHKWIAIHIDIPEEDTPHADPQQLVPTAQELVQLFADGKLVELYERFTPELKSAWPAQKFETQMTGLREALGTFQESSHAGTTASNEGQPGQRVQLKATFENAEKSVKINLVDRGGTWQALGFTIE